MSDRQRHRIWIPYIVLVGMILVTLLFSHYAAITAQARDQLRFDNAVQRTQATIQNRLDTYVALLYAGRGLFAASDRVTQQDFQTFVNQLQLQQRYPGIQGIGFSARVLSDELDSFLTEMRSQGLENFSVRPQAPPRDEYHTIVYLEPMDRRNQAAIGYDMFTEPRRRAAMERARDTGVHAASSKVILVQEIDIDKQAGFLIYVPIYRTGEVPPTVAERREALEGFIYSPFRADDFLEGVLGNERERRIDIQVYDGTELQAEKLLHRSKDSTSTASPHFIHIAPMDVGGQPWSLVFTSRPEFEASLDRNQVPYILLSGLGLAAVLFAMTRSQNRARIAAEQTAISLQRSEAALREREARLRCLVDANIIGVVVGDQQGQILEANDAFLNIVGCSREELLSGYMNWANITSLEQPNSAESRIEGQPIEEQPIEGMLPLRNQDPFQKEYLRKDGTRIPVMVGTAVLDEPGNLGVGFIIDLTKQKRAEKAVQQSEIRFRTLIEQSPLSTQIFSPNGKTVQVNRAWENLWGLSLDLLGEYNILQDQQLVDLGIMPYVQKGFAGEATIIPPVQYDPKQAIPGKPTCGGPQRWVQAFIYPVKDEGGNIREVVLLHEDITERKLAEQALQNTNDRLGLLYSMSSSLLLHEQPKGFITSLFNQLSRHLQLEVYLCYLFDREQGILQLHAFGGLPEALVQQIARVAVGQAVCGKVAQERQPMVVESVQQNTEAIVEHIRSLDITAYACYPLLSHGQLIGTLSFGTRNRPNFSGDELALMQVVSEQVATALERSRLIAELQQQTKELSQANQAKDEFLATLSHELRTPLNAILGWTQLLRTRKFDEKTTNRALETIDRNTKSLAQLIEDILDVSRIITGKLRLNLSNVALIPVIEAAIDTIRAAAEAKNIQITTQFDPEVGTVIGDENRLQQIVWNLLSNAVKFTPNGGQIEIRLEQIEIEETLKGEKLQDSFSRARISVSDTGRGISSDFLPHVFDRFRQADSSTTRTFGGLGLGLAIVRHLVELQGGTVYAESPGEGQGTTFNVELPLSTDRISLSAPKQTASTPQDELPFIKQHPLNGVQVLVIDDEIDTRELIATVLQQAGADVTTVASANQALEAIPQLKPDVLVSDIGMPDMDGYTLIRQIRTMPAEQGGTIPAIALTAYAGIWDQQQALSAGFQLHLSKPIEPEAFVEAISTLVSS